MITETKHFTIATPIDVARFFNYLVFDLGVNVSPDDDFADYIDKEGNNSFSDDEAKHLNDTMDACLGVCETYGVDIYTLTCKVLSAFHYADGNDKLAEIYANI